MNIKDLRIGNTILFATTESEVIGGSDAGIKYRHEDGLGRLPRQSQYKELQD